MKIKRANYLVHPSSQLKYIIMSVVPAVVMTVFCTYFLFKSGELIMQAQKDRLAVEFSSLRSSFQDLDAKTDNPEIKREIAQLQRGFDYLYNSLKLVDAQGRKKWYETKIVIMDMSVVVVVLVAFLSLIFSHRVAGPLIRMRRSINLLTEGKDIPPVKFRDYDEFKELADSLEQLRQAMKNKGMLNG